MSWWVIGALAAGAYAAKFAGLVIGPRLGELRRFERMLGVLPIAVLAAVTVVLTFDGGRRLVFDARAVGVLAGAVAAIRRLPFVAVVAIASVVTALLRL